MADWIIFKTTSRVVEYIATPSHSTPTTTDQNWATRYSRIGAMSAVRVLNQIQPGTWSIRPVLS